MLLYLFFVFLYLCSSGLTFKNNLNIFSKCLFWSISVDGWDMAQGEEKSCTAAESLIYESGWETLQFWIVIFFFLSFFSRTVVSKDIALAYLHEDTEMDT